MNQQFVMEKLIVKKFPTSSTEYPFQNVLLLLMVPLDISEIYLNIQSFFEFS